MTTARRATERAAEARRRGTDPLSWYLVAALLIVSPMVATSQQLLDRVVARVGATVITQTDVDAALALGIAEPAPGEDRIAGGTRQLIDRQLLLAEVARFPPPEPSAADIDAIVARMRARAGADFEAAMKRTGRDAQRIRELARDTLRIQAYIDQRFGATAQASAQEAREYYDTHPQEFRRNGVVPPFEDVELAARQSASAERRRRTVAQWVADLRTRGEVIELSSRP
jgi:hypothetical protein